MALTVASAGLSARAEAPSRWPDVTPRSSCRGRPRRRSAWVTSSPRRLGAGQDLERGVEVDHGGGELGQDGDVALDLRRAVLDLGFERLGAHHRLLEVRAVDGERQVGLRGQEAREVRERGVLELDRRTSRRCRA